MNETTDKVSAATINVASNEEATSTEAVEEWRPVVGFEGLYEVSNTGLVRSLHGRRGKVYMMKQKLTRYGYMSIHLRNKDVVKDICVHILVAKAFIPNPENKDQIDHINTIRTDNRVENLRWATSHENHINPITIKNYKEKFSSDLYRQHKREDYYRSGAKEALEAANEERKRAVYCIELDMFFESANAAARATGLGDSNIGVSCNRYANNVRSVAYRGGKRVLHWRWATPEEIEAHKQQPE